MGHVAPNLSFFVRGDGGVLFYPLFRSDFFKHHNKAFRLGEEVVFPEHQAYPEDIFHHTADHTHSPTSLSREHPKRKGGQGRKRPPPPLKTKDSNMPTQTVSRSLLLSSFSLYIQIIFSASLSNLIFYYDLFDVLCLCKNTFWYQLGFATEQCSNSLCF